jgi:hypothetical protein
VSILFFYLLNARLTSTAIDVAWRVVQVSHLIHRDYEAIVEDFVTLDFIPPGTDLKPILPVLAKVFDQVRRGTGAFHIGNRSPPRTPTATGTGQGCAKRAVWLRFACTI